MAQWQTLSDRINTVAPSATLAVDSKAKAMKAAGLDVVGFGAGEPNFPTPANVVKAAADACLDPKNYKYTPTPGLPELREAIAAKMLRDSGYEANADQVVVTNGGKQAVYESFQILLNDGDEVIIPTPCWVSYSEMVKLTGAAPVFVPCKAETGFALNVDDIAAAVTPHTKAIIICTPNNPTGAVYSEQTLRALAVLAVEKDFYIIADEIYEKLIFGDAKHFSIASISEEVRERCVTINGFSKAYAIPGWRLGYSAAVGEVAASIKSIQSHATSAANCIAQRAGVAALTGPQDSVEAMRREYERRRDYAFGALKAMPGVELEMPHGAFYLFPKVDSYFGTQYQNYQINSSKDLANYLLDEAEFAVVFGEAFYMNGYLRISYANSMENIQEALRRMAEALKKLGRE